MDRQLLEKLAEAAGLQLAFRLFPDDVATAAAQVAKQRQALQDSLPPEAEPWPPMKVPEL